MDTVESWDNDIAESVAPAGAEAGDGPDTAEEAAGDGPPDGDTSGARSGDDRARAARPQHGEAPFQLDEVFFSRTDARGVIRAGNNVFRRVADYDWDAMLGAPHKVIRHPDMPKGLFWLFWDRIKRGETIGAYVRNRARDGLSYWVFAVAMPCGDGYLSARIKPTSELRDQVEELYAEQVRQERDQGLSPQDSAAWMQERIAAMGFPDYPRFAAHALSEELMARDAGLGLGQDQCIGGFRTMLDCAESLKSETDMLVREFAMTEIIPHNMRVIASRLEPNGGPISTLSTNYGGMSREMSRWFQTNVVGESSNFGSIEGTVSESMFIECMVRLLNECARQLDTERHALGPVDLKAERGYLDGLATDYRAKARARQDQLAEETRRILDACKKMNRHILGLSTTRVMCKIEGARLYEGRESLNDIIGELNGIQQRIRASLARIEDLSGTIRGLLT
ncbi:chemotaxis protein [Psychromarinibacter sp. C21-152]|uniref:Chemotaxis protein n=1 Tax=Psychromarinibacter sediminicola TaxID=3033385 RepID=A0AAE3NRN0_9RHOB|nr:chemotaxis protein [Psychromarinibacter sediminicola]MDF0600389.1 chemotaxis protein [Psychromarinibacter sediminicola]